MVNYGNGKIYALRSNQTEKVYIGSTCQTLSQRIQDHKKQYNNLQNCRRFKGSITANEILKFPDVYIELIKLFPCLTKEELRREEGKEIRNTNCVNKRIDGRTREEWRNEHRTELREKSKIYREENKEQIKLSKSIKVVCECGISCRRNDIARHKKSKKHLDFINS